MAKQCKICNKELSFRNSFYYENKNMCRECLNKVQPNDKFENQSQKIIPEKEYNPVDELNNILRSGDFQKIKNMNDSEQVKQLILTFLKGNNSSERKKAEYKLSDYGIRIITASQWASSWTFRIIFLGLVFSIITIVSSTLPMNKQPDFIGAIGALIAGYISLWIFFRIIAAMLPFPKIKFIKAKKGLNETKKSELKNAYSKMSLTELEKLLEKSDELIPEASELIQGELKNRKTNIE